LRFCIKWSVVSVDAEPAFDNTPGPVLFLDNAGLGEFEPSAPRRILEGEPGAAENRRGD
jgi:hypothetical protein